MADFFRDWREISKIKGLKVSFQYGLNSNLTYFEYAMSHVLRESQEKNFHPNIKAIPGHIKEDIKKKKNQI